MRPYLVIPKLIEQPTWGGLYILNIKGWDTNPAVAGHRIGQTYELFGESKLALTITDSRDERFAPEWGFADRPDTVSELFPLSPTDYIPLKECIKTDAVGTLGEKTIQQYGEVMPLLIKLNQALGNSFQLHIPYEIKSDRWIPKPETWFYFEDGLASMGLKAGADVAAYKKTCLEIERQMQELSTKVRSGALPLDEARMQAQKMVQTQNPWQFVNVIEVKKGDVVDPSAGGIHHSWEEDTTRFPLGNVVFEIQLDAMDPVATIRSFDQGKIKDDGSVRAMNIEDYFTYLKTDSDSNDVARLCTHPSGDELIKTDYYRLQRMGVEGSRTVALEGSFHCVHCYAGSLTIRAGEGEVHIHTGHTAFIPAGCGQYTLHSDTQATALVGSVV